MSRDRSPKQGIGEMAAVKGIPGAVFLWIIFFCIGSTHALDLEELPARENFAPVMGELIEAQHGASGAYVLESGDEALLVRGWMLDNAGETIDIMTLIWSLDRIGLPMTGMLLLAAERGVKVRILVDDFMVDRHTQEILLALNHHLNIQVRIYNPLISVGVSPLRLIYNVVTDFRMVNQRLHNKSFIIDGLAGITGGRNMASEYFDYDQEYNFRDRDILVVGPVAGDMVENFNDFWGNPLARPLELLLAEQLKDFPLQKIEQTMDELRQETEGLARATPVIREALADQPRRMGMIFEHMYWNDIRFISDTPYKNKSGCLRGGGRMLEELTELFGSARNRITIQSPYLILPQNGMGLFEKLAEGVEIRISTNSLASTDDTRTFSGYSKQRRRLLEKGFDIREFRPDPEIQQDLIRRFRDLEQFGPPIFSMHAKTIVIDGEILFIGTFNIDPRAANLNTEEGVIIRDPELAKEVEKRIKMDMLPENSWNPREENPDHFAGWWRQFKNSFFRLFPLDPIL
jgi:cardiolipin synthase C